MAGTQASLPQSHGAWEGNGEHNLSGLTHLLISTMAAVLRSSAGEGGGAARKQIFVISIYLALAMCQVLF